MLLPLVHDDNCVAKANANATLVALFLASLVYTTVYPFAKITLAGVGNLVCSGMIKESNWPQMA